MSGNIKILITNKGKVNLDADGWDKRLASFLKEKSGIDENKAINITQFLKNQIKKWILILLQFL